MHVKRYCIRKTRDSKTRDSFQYTLKLCDENNGLQFSQEKDAANKDFRPAGAGFEWLGQALLGHGRSGAMVER